MTLRFCALYEVPKYYRACVEVGTLKHAIFTSSLLVCELGYIPSHEEDYCPPNLYGESKRDMEVLIRKQNDVLRLHGLSFDQPQLGALVRNAYNLFFKTVSRGLYVHTSWKDVTKPNCYVGNAFVMQKIFEYADQRVHPYVLSSRLPTAIGAGVGQ